MKLLTFTPTQLRQIEERIAEARRQGIMEGRRLAEIEFKERTCDSDRQQFLREQEYRFKAIDAMAHALKAMADVVEPRRV